MPGNINKITNDDRNSYSQIISNGREFGQQLTYFPLKLELQKFNRVIYNKMIDGTTDTFVFAEGVTPDTTPRVISEADFVDTQLFADASISSLFNMTIYGEGAEKITILPEGGESMRMHMKIDVFNRDHCLRYDKLLTETEIVYVGRLAIGTQLKLKPADIHSAPIADAPNFEPSGISGNKSYHCIKLFDEVKDSRLKSHLDSGTQKDLFYRWNKDYKEGGFDNHPDWKPDDDKPKLGNYADKTFAGGIIEVDRSGIVKEIYKVGGKWSNVGKRAKSPGIKEGTVGVYQTAYAVWNISNHFSS